MQNNLRNTIITSHSSTFSRALFTIALFGGMIVQNTQAAIALDRTRVIFDGSQKSVSLNISNQNKQLPYLAQGWIEDEQGNKIQSPLTVLPPVQRIEPGKPSQVKIQGMPATKNLPQDRETVYYFNLREIPQRVTSRIRYKLRCKRASSCSTAQQLLRWSKTHRHRRSN
ncbi:fimbrial protein StfD [Klebsiella pneumoniae]|nr:fimbrial protein StfD [Klebsiella pneumoniae]